MSEETICWNDYYAENGNTVVIFDEIVEVKPNYPIYSDYESESENEE